MLATNLKILMVVLITVGAYTLVANTIPQIESEVPEALQFTGDFSVDDLVEAGDELYQGAGGCTACHGLGTRAPHLLADEGGTGLIGTRCATRVAGQDCKSYLHASMVDPGAYVVAGYDPIMPDMRRTLSDTQIWAIIAYLQSLGGEVTVTVDDVQEASGGAQVGGPEGAPRGGPAAAGAGPGGSTEPTAILQQNQCMACHTLAGTGGPIGPPLESVAGMDTDYIRRSILDPNADTAAGYEALAGTMPATFGSQLTAAQLEALVSFLQRGGRP